MIHELALFAGVGGGILGGVLEGWRTVAAVEIDPFCREVLLRRQRDGMLPLFPIWDDARTFDGKSWRGIVDIITAGFPCQPFSSAGKRQGEQDDRNMWPDTIRVIREVGPRFVFLENVPGLLAHAYFGTILGELAESGYDCRWDCIPASALGAPHQRDRLWIVANNNRERGKNKQECEFRSSHSSHIEHDGPQESMADAESERSGASRAKSGESQGASGVGRSGEPMANSTVKRLEGGASTRYDIRSERMRFLPAGQGQQGRTSDWPAEPDVGRVAHGVAHRVDRLKALGNGQVPRAAQAAWEVLK